MENQGGETDLRSRIRLAWMKIAIVSAPFGGVYGATLGAVVDTLGVYRAVRDSRLLPEEAEFFLVSLLIDELATRDADDGRDSNGRHSPANRPRRDVQQGPRRSTGRRQA